MKTQVWNYDEMAMAAENMHLVLSGDNSLEYSILEFETVLNQLKWEGMAADQYRATAANYFSAIRSGIKFHQWYDEIVSSKQVIFKLIDLLILNKQTMQKKERELTVKILNIFTTFNK